MKANSNAAGVDHVTVEAFERHLEANLEKLSQSLRDGTYRPEAIRRAWIPKLGSKEMRPLGIPRRSSSTSAGAGTSRWRERGSGSSRSCKATSSTMQYQGTSTA